MKTSKLILLWLICITATIPAIAQDRNEKKAKIERAVKEAIDSKDFKINIDRMQPMRGGSRTLTSNYSLKIKNDSVFSNLPYFGVAYSIPYGGGKGLNFNEPTSKYKIEHLKKGKVRIDFETRSEGDNYKYSLTIFPSGSASINVLPTNRQSISFIGDMETKE